MFEASHRFCAGKRLFVAGCGYVGSAVARQGMALGMEVHALTRNPVMAAGLRDAGIKVMVADLATADWHGQLPGEMDFVLNSVSSGGGGLEGYRHSYSEGMASLLQWARAAKIGTCVYTSSTSVYPQGGGVVVDETAPLESVADERALVLCAAEQQLRASTAVGRAYILRLAGIYGPGRHHLLDQIRTGGVLPGGWDHRLNLIHRDDAAAAVWAAWGAPDAMASGTYNVADDGPVTKAALIEWLAGQLGVPAPTFDARQPTRRGRDVPDRVIANAKIKRELGWRPRYPDYRAGYAAILAAL
ncbi:MAG: NAD-dependent epimerase/dehydratase family protein [Opitutaceae bacterium]|nr:NAD-dependent epimerase/dehydratase family protein [Opitutaceae bacterium]